MSYYHHQEVCLFNVFRYCQSRVIESLFLIERLWREEVCREKENLSEMFLVFKQLLRRRGRVAKPVESAGRPPSFIHHPFTAHFLVQSEKNDFWKLNIN